MQYSLVQVGSLTNSIGYSLPFILGTSTLLLSAIGHTHHTTLIQLPDIVRLLFLPSCVLILILLPMFSTFLSFCLVFCCSFCSSLPLLLLLFLPPLFLFFSSLLVFSCTFCSSLQVFLFSFFSSLQVDILLHLLFLLPSSVLLCFLSSPLLVFF